MSVIQVPASASPEVIDALGIQQSSTSTSSSSTSSSPFTSSTSSTITINKPLFYTFTTLITSLIGTSSYMVYKLYRENQLLKQQFSAIRSSATKQQQYLYELNGSQDIRHNEKQWVDHFDDEIQIQELEPLQRDANQQLLQLHQQQQQQQQSSYPSTINDASTLTSSVLCEPQHYSHEHDIPMNIVGYLHDKSIRDLPRTDPIDGKRLAIIVVDPISTGANIAHEVSRRGFEVISLLSGQLDDNLLNLIDPSIKVDYAAILTHDETQPHVTLQRLQGFSHLHIVGLIAGSEPGVEVAEDIAERLGLPGNGTKGSDARRDKYIMGETIRRAGVRAVQQRKCGTWNEVVEFIKEWNPSPFKVVIKPVKSAGSDHVYLCEDMNELEKRFEMIVGKKNQLGLINTCALLQEYLQGSEYVVDTVSRAGHHKIAAIWKYDKRKHAGYNFVYYGQEAVDTSQPFCTEMSKYMMKVLDAVGIHDSAGHAEVIMTPTGPCLVEVGARCQGGEGTFIPLANMTWGYNQVEMVVAAQISDEEFNLYPDTLAGGLLTYGYKVDLVSGVSGKLIKLNHLSEIEALPSFHKFDFMPQPGQMIHVTIDCFTEPGSLLLIHKDKEQVEKDLTKLRALEKTMFVVENDDESNAEGQEDKKHKQ